MPTLTVPFTLQWQPHSAVDGIHHRDWIACGLVYLTPRKFVGSVKTSMGRQN